MQLRTRCNPALTGGVSFRVQKECFIHVYSPVNVEVELKVRLRKKRDDKSNKITVLHMVMLYQRNLFADTRYSASGRQKGPS
jgi:hypothetical protein